MAEEFKKQFPCLKENTEKYITFTVPIENEVPGIHKNGDLWQAHYQILPIMFLKEFRKLNVNLDTMIKHVKHVELNINLTTGFLNTYILKMIQ